MIKYIWPLFCLVVACSASKAAEGLDADGDNLGVDPVNDRETKMSDTPKDASVGMSDAQMEINCQPQRDLVLTDGEQRTWNGAQAAYHYKRVACDAESRLQFAHFGATRCDLQQNEYLQFQVDQNLFETTIFTGLPTNIDTFAGFQLRYLVQPQDSGRVLEWGTCSQLSNGTVTFSSLATKKGEKTIAAVEAQLFPCAHEASAINITGQFEVRLEDDFGDVCFAP